VAVNVSATDNDEIADVTLLIDGQPVAGDFVAPYQFLLNPNRFTPGAHAVRAVATDVSGNSAEHEISLIFAGPPDLTRPSVHMVSPANGAQVSGIVTIRADAVDNRSVALAEVFVDASLIGSVPFQEAGARLAFNWDATTVAPGTHTIAVRVYDSSGNSSLTSVSVTVTR
ncbi:MAG: Ig-like domain-containing protein, partial [Phycisphaerae bacterium]